MRLIPDWQYKFIEKCLYDYNTIRKSHKTTYKNMVLAINEAKKFFKDNPHDGMMEHYYFEHAKHRRRLTNSGHFDWVCRDCLYMEPSNGWVIRREIIYKVAMNCYALGVFKLRINSIDSLK